MDRRSRRPSSSDKPRMKRCGICGEKKPVDDSFYSWQHFNGSWYFRSYCRDCDNTRRTNYFVQFGK